MEIKTDFLKNKLQRFKTAPVIFIHIDTTGVTNDDEIIRLTILADNALIYDEIYFSAKPINPFAAQASGLTESDILESNVYIETELEKLSEMIGDKLVVCCNESFTKKFLKKAGLTLSDDNVLDIAKGTNYFSKNPTKNAKDVFTFYQISNPNQNTFNKTFLLYECATKMQIVCRTLLK